MIFCIVGLLHRILHCLYTGIRWIHQTVEFLYNIRYVANTSSLKCILLQRFINITRGPWSTSLTWENTRISSMYFRYFVITSLWKRAELRSTKDSLCKDWLKLAQWFWRSRLLNFVNVFSLFCYYLPLEKNGIFHLNKHNSFIQGCFVLSLVEIGLVVLE